MPYLRKSVRAAAAVLILGLLATSAARAEGPDIDGKTIPIILSSGAGGGSDLEARLVARHMEKHLPGDVHLVVQNLTGGGGVKAINHFMETDPDEETVIAIVASALPFRARAGVVATDFDPREAQWLGSVSESADVCFVSAASGVESIDDLREREITVGARSRSSGAYGTYAMLMRGLGLKLKPVVGYDNVQSIALAVERGELEGFCTIRAQMITNLMPMIEAGTLKPIEYTAPYPIEAMADIPYLFDLEMTEEQQDYLRSAYLSVRLGRPLAMHPDTDPALVAIFRKALTETLQDEELLADLDRAGISLHYTSAEDIAAEVDALYAMPDDLADEIADLYYGTN